MKTIEITVNEQKAESERKSTVSLRSIWEEESMKDCLSVRSPEFRMKTGFARMLRMRFVKSRFR